jgi:hypothetical protein
VLRRLLALALASVLASPRTARADPPDAAAIAVEVATARERYHRALDEARWNRDAPAVRALADELTDPLLEHFERPSALRDELRALLIDLDGEALGPWITRHHALLDTGLVGAWLRRHDDPELLAQSLRAGASLRDLLPWVARYRPQRAPGLLSDARRQLSLHDAEVVCASALLLPDARLREFVDSAQSDLDSLPVGSAPCVAALASHPAGRQALATRLSAALQPPRGSTALRGVIFEQGVSPSLAVAALLLLPTAHAPVAQRAFDRIPAQTSSPAGVFWRSQFISDLARVAPHLAYENPRVATALRRLLDGPVRGVRLVPLLVRLRDAALLPALLDETASMRAPSSLGLASAVALLGATTPNNPASVARASAALREVRGRVRAYNVHDVTVAQVDLWLDALDATARCHDAACLRALLTTGGDASAARAAWVLGPAGLAELDERDATALVRRVVLRSHPPPPNTPDEVSIAEATLAVFVLPTLRGCPPRLRALTMTPPLRLLREWQDAFERQCRDTPGASE